MRELSRLITKIARETKEKIVLLIDEVDKTSNNQLFLDFLGMLRDKYLSREAGEDYINDYLERLNLKNGFLVIYDLRKTKYKEWKQQVIEHKGKEIYTIWV